MPLTIVADDLTGACDTGALFAGPGAVPVAVWPGLPAPARVRVADTESRMLAPAEAAARLSRAVPLLGAGRYFKKIDSTLRGRVGVEVDALMRATGTRSALLCPAFPAEGRVVVERALLVDGVPVTRTAVAGDPAFPAGARLRSEGDVIDLLRPQLDRPLSWIPLEQVRAGGPDLVARLGRLRGTVALADAETDDDLTLLVGAALAVEPPPLLVGAAGLARALAERLALLPRPPALPAGSRWLVVAGSRHPATRRQLELARESGMTVLASADADESDRASVADRLATAARRALETEAWDLVIVTGGETAVALYRALAAEGIDLVGAPAPGLALGYLRAPAHRALPLLTKAGGFGPPHLLVSLQRKAVA